jgi:hypothetical protein
MGSPVAAKEQLHWKTGIALVHQATVIIQWCWWQNDHTRVSAKSSRASSTGITERNSAVRAVKRILLPFSYHLNLLLDEQIMGVY